MRDSRVAGFTLVELLIVVAIMVTLVAMAMPLLAFAERAAKRGNSEAILRKVDAAARQFQRDLDVLPYQPSYPDAVDESQPFPNRLALRLGRALGDAERSAVLALAATAAGKYRYSQDLNSTSSTAEAGLPSPLTFRMAYVPLTGLVAITQSYGNLKVIDTRRAAAVLNRMAAGRARDAVMAGATDLRGGFIVSGGVVHQDLTGQALLSPAEIGDAVGWCDDYLVGELEPSRRRGDAVLDAWGNPLIQVGQLVPKARPLSLRLESIGSLQTVRVASIDGFGLGAQGFATGTGPWGDLAAAGRHSLLGNGRVQLVTGVPAHAAFLPDATDWRRSDRRYYAPRGGHLDLELWSAGPDGRLAWMRDDPANRDNCSASVYDKGLGR